MKFSVIICTYNQADSLRRTLDNISAQDAPSEFFEILVVDNNSKDNTRKVAEEAFCNIPFKCHYIFEPRQGLSAARNRGLQEAAGEYAIFTDDDAGLPSTWLQSYLSAYERYQADCVFGRISVDWAKGKPAWYSKSFGPMFVELDYGDTPHAVKDLHHEFFGKNFSVRRELILQIGGFDENLGRKGDRLFAGEETRIYQWLVTTERAVMYIPQILVYHHLKDYEYTEEHCYKHARDTVMSDYYMLKTGSSRKVLGRPLYTIKSIACNLPTLIFQHFSLSKSSNYSSKFYIKLQLFKTLLLLKLWILNRK